MSADHPNQSTRWIAIAGRCLIAVLFAGGAVQKALDPAPAMALLAGLSLPEVLVWQALVFNAVAAVLLVAGLWLERVALALATYCIVTSVFHYVPEDAWQISILVKNWAIAGGCLCLAALAREQRM
ncbi:DoxX family protein [Pseudaestuariivita sp.]|uniref:DoxX family protein n=1 Tax=Pseudaestuariivita sp. TaxID=2211669 RepID=UPI0040580310